MGADAGHTIHRTVRTAGSVLPERGVAPIRAIAVEETYSVFWCRTRSPRPERGFGVAVGFIDPTFIRGNANGPRGSWNGQD